MSDRTPRIARPAGLEGVEVHTGAAEAETHARRISPDYVLLVASGSHSTTVEAGDHAEAIREEALLMVEPETVVWISTGEPYAYQALYISPAAFAALFALAPGDPTQKVALPRLVSKSPVVVRMFLAAHRALESARDPLEAQIALLNLIFGLLGANLLYRHPEAHNHPAVISRARDHLRSSYSRGMTLDELSRRVGMSKYALVRAFTREFGIAPHMYQTYLRVMRARSLIRDGSPISEAALDVGFTDQSHLNRHFKRILGYTPGAYAKQVRATHPGN